MGQIYDLQSHLNLLYREEEREMFPLCQSEGLGVITFSPLAAGDSLVPGLIPYPLQTDTVTKFFYGAAEEADRRVVEAVTRVAERRGVPRACRNGLGCANPASRPQSLARPNRNTSMTHLRHSH